MSGALHTWTRFLGEKDTRNLFSAYFTQIFQSDKLFKHLGRFTLPGCLGWRCYLNVCKGCHLEKEGNAIFLKCDACTCKNPFQGSRFRLPRSIPASIKLSSKPSSAEDILRQAIALNYLHPFSLDGRPIPEALKKHLPALPLIFKGQDRGCTIAFANFKNCCTDGKGWGVSLGISGCDGEERDLANRQQKGLCHEIGTYCAEKVLGVCIRKKRRYCCFPTKLARMLQVQGRAQLGIPWGSAENPDCRGLSASELARINFDQLDLTEAFADLAPKVSSCEVVHRNLSQNVMNLKPGCTGKKEGL